MAAPLPNWSGTAGWSIAIYNTAYLLPGSYDGSCTVSSPSFAGSPVAVPVHAVANQLSANGPAIPPEICFVDRGSVISLIGQAALQGHGLSGTITSATSWIVATPDGKDALIDGTSLPAGVHTGQVTIAVAGDAKSPYQLTVFVIETGTYYNGGGEYAADLIAAPAILSFLVETGDAPKHAELGVWPAGGIRKSFSAAAEAPWLPIADRRFGTIDSRGDCRSYPRLRIPLKPAADCRLESAARPLRRSQVRARHESAFRISRDSIRAEKTTSPFRTAADSAPPR
jgi:hypothetical protein